MICGAHFLRIVWGRKGRFAYFTILMVLGCFSVYNSLWDSSTCACSSWSSLPVETQQELLKTLSTESRNKSLNDVAKDVWLPRPHSNQSSKFKHLITTTSCKNYYFLLILVSSASSNFERRRNIRLTWGVDTFLTPRWKTAFVVAQPRDQHESNVLLKETITYEDILRVDFCDSYFSQTIKMQIGFEWASRYCKFSFLLRLDDDAVVNTMEMLAVLKAPNTPQKKLYMGLLAAKAAAIRSGKYGVSKAEYSSQFYPPFCPGFGVIFSADVVALFVDLFDLVPLFRLEDVYMGMVAQKAGIEALNKDGFEAQPKPEIKCTGMTSRTLVRLGITGECLFRLYKDTILNYT